MNDSEFRNALHNTIDLNKKIICDLLKNGTKELNISFWISAGEPVEFWIDTKKHATSDFSKVKPFIYRGKEEK